ncbi:MAG: sulfite oxidase-like oxidoreductase [Nitrospirota bacterium]|nr:sulfite oxidase-like oxidoreductase [Nitrospirota bacterium]MDE3243458.1 sulfite oxidase-like oxidoreductase [Nitrospirota bacterium]
MQEPNEKLIAKKEEWAKAKRGLVEDGVVQDHRARGSRLPPGQHLSKGWPVLDLGIHPDLPLGIWTLTVSGLVEHPFTWTWEQFLAQPQVELVTDFHCVTTWSTFDNVWKGVAFRHILQMVQPKPEARFVYFTSYDNYSTNLPLDACDDDDVLLIHSWNGNPLPKEHGGPVRMHIPKRYAWKGSKWVKEIVFLAEDKPGYWEVRGYSNTALPWEEDRYA